MRTRRRGSAWGALLTLGIVCVGCVYDVRVVPYIPYRGIDTEAARRALVEEVRRAKSPLLGEGNFAEARIDDDRLHFGSTVVPFADHWPILMTNTSGYPSGYPYFAAFFRISDGDTVQRGTICIESLEHGQRLIDAWATLADGDDRGE